MPIKKEEQEILGAIIDKKIKGTIRCLKASITWEIKGILQLRKVSKHISRAEFQIITPRVNILTGWVGITYFVDWIRRVYRIREITEEWFFWGCQSWRLQNWNKYPSS